MRKLTLITAVAGTALAFAAPAAAHPNSAPQGYGYGYNNTGQVRSMQARIDNVQRQIDRLSMRRMISRNEANGLGSESRNLENRLMRSARYGLNPMEARNIEYGIARLERHVAHEARDGRGYGYNGNSGYGYPNGQYGNGYNGYGYNNAYYSDRDGDGRDDNDEHDRWHDQHGDDNDDD